MNRSIKRPLPENFRRLWDAEDEVIVWAEGIVASSEHLQDHLDLVEAYMDCVESVRQSGLSGARHVALGGLFLRTFDSMSHCIRHALSGDYGGSAMFARDLVETQFLLSYLMDEDGRPEDWLSSSPEQVRQKYSAKIVRDALDKRDGLSERKRLQHYSALSALGSHPTPSSFELKRDGTRIIHSGPFKNRELLDSCLQEAARAAITLGAILVQFSSHEVTDGRKRSSRLSLVLQRTKEKYFRG